MKKNLIAILSGVLFGFGLCLSQMVNPEKVLGFLDISGNWDPSLAFVMMGALTVTLITFRFILKRQIPLFDSKFYLSNRQDIDKRLIIGAALFGIGWGMSGYCPGPVVTGMGLQISETFIVLVSIYAGFFSHQLLLKKWPQ